MTFAWPPRPVGSGTPFNLATLSKEPRARLRREWWVAPLIGIGVAGAVVAVDQVFFAGETTRRMPALTEHPAPAWRPLLALGGALYEALVFRVVAASMVAWLAYLMLARAHQSAPRVSQLLGVIAAAVLVGLWHVGRPEDAVRVVTVNVVANVVYGWLYFARGLEFSVLAHAVATACLFLVVPALY